MEKNRNQLKKENMSATFVNEPYISKTTCSMVPRIVIPLKARRPRIIVEMFDPETPRRNSGQKQVDKIPTSMLERPMRETKIEVLNSEKLVFYVNNNSSNVPRNTCRRVLCFDCVAPSGNDQPVRSQMSALADQLLLTGRNNCCVLRVSPTRSKPSLHILSHTLIPEINKRLKSADMLPMLLYAIRVEYYDVRKYDVVNMVLRAAPKNKPRHQITFRNTWELLHWVQDEYPGMWALGAGHECLDLKFIFLKDRNETKIRVKLSLVQFYISKMDVEMQAGLRNFLENAGANNTTRIKHSILTDYLREYFFSPDNWYMWMIFNVPSAKDNGMISEILTLATSAYIGAENLIVDKMKSLVTLKNRTDLETEFLYPLFNSIQTPVEPSKPIKTPNKINGAPHALLRTRKKDEQTLSYWYRQLDERFLNVLMAMETYYECKYRPNKPDAIGDGKTLAKLKERKTFITTVRNVPRDTTTADHHHTYAMHLLSSQYKHAVEGLHFVIKQIQKSPYGRQLKVLIQTKNNQLIEHMQQQREQGEARHKERLLKRDDSSSSTKSPTTMSHANTSQSF